MTNLIYELNKETIWSTTGTSTAIFTSWVSDQTASTISSQVNDSIFIHYITSGTTICNDNSFSINSYLPHRADNRPQNNRINRLQMEQAAREAEARRIKSRRKKRIAEARAEILLKQALTPAQKAQLKRFGYFFVEGNKTGNRYRIRNGRSLNVDIMQGNKVAARLCAHPSDDVPNMDTMLVQKIYLECMEDEFLRIANRQ